MQKRDFPSSHSSIVAAIEVGNSYSTSRRLCSAVCDKSFWGTSDAWCMITLGHTRLDGQHISYRSSVGRFLIIHPIARTSRSVISIFSCTSRNSFPVIVSVFRVTERLRWVSHTGSNPSRQTSKTLGYKSWSHVMTNVSNLEANLLKNISTLAVTFPIGPKSSH